VFIYVVVLQVLPISSLSTSNDIQLPDDFFDHTADDVRREYEANKQKMDQVCCYYYLEMNFIQYLCFYDN
jgi:hypothetical protein